MLLDLGVGSACVSQRSGALVERGRGISNGVSDFRSWGSPDHSEENLHIWIQHDGGTRIMAVVSVLVRKSDT